MEALLPDDLERHIQMNRSKLVGYATLRAEMKPSLGGHETAETRHDCVFSLGVEGSMLRRWCPSAWPTEGRRGETVSDWTSQL